MDCEHSKGRMNVECDRLSVLPDELIHKILSFTSIHDAIRTSGLSSRWRFIWTSLPYLNISVDRYSSLPRFNEFVRNVLSRRDGQIDLYSVEFTFHQMLCEKLLKTVLGYAFSHNVQRLTISYLRDEGFHFPLHLFHSHSLKYFRLSGSCTRLTGSFFISGVGCNIVLASTWELPALTTLHLDHVTFHQYSDDDDIVLFSKCVNLKNLTLDNFGIRNLHNVTIFHPQLSNLTLKDADGSVGVVNVVAPLLEHLTIRSSFGKHMIDAPKLASLFFNGSCHFQFSSDLCSLEKVYLCVSYTGKWSDCQIAALLQQIHHVKFLTLNLEFLKPLISYMEQISLQRSVFFNLKSLKIYPIYLYEPYEEVTLSTKVVNYLLDGSTNATFTLVSYEEARALANAREAQNRIKSLHRTLENEKANIKSNRTRTGRGKTPIESREMGTHDQGATPMEKRQLHFKKKLIRSNRTRMDRGKTQVKSREMDTHDQGAAPVEKTQLHSKRKMTQMQSYLDEVNLRIDEGKRKSDYIISQLREIEALLLKDLPTSKRDGLQACYCSLCAEVHTVVKEILHHMNSPQLNDCYDELDTTSVPSS